MIVHDVGRGYTLYYYISSFHEDFLFILLCIITPSHHQCQTLAGDAGPVPCIYIL